MCYNDGEATKGETEMMETFPSIVNDIENALTYYALKQENNNDFIVLTSGHEACKSNKRKIGPTQHGYYILHCVHKGKGHLKLTDKKGTEKSFLVESGQLFLLYPNVNVSYWPDETEPWEYSWICFCGSAAFDYASRLTDKDTPVIRIKQYDKAEKIFRKLQNLDDYPHSKDLRVLALTMEIFSEIIEAGNGEKQPDELKNYVRDCLLYIQKNYKNPDLSVKLIADKLGLNEKYLSRLFTAAIQMPLSRYITLLRLQKACSLLNNTEMTVKEISLYVGYNDPLYFSRSFSGHLGLPPTEWRKQNQPSEETK